MVIATIWVSEGENLVKLNYLSHEGLPEFLFEDLGSFRVNNPDIKGFPVLLVFDAKTMSLHLPLFKKEDSKAHLNWLAKTGGLKSFKEIWNTAPGPLEYEDGGANPFMLAALYNGESYLESVPEIENYASLKYINGEPSQYYISARGNLDFAIAIKNRDIFNVPNLGGEYPIHRVIQYGHEDLAYWLIDELDQAMRLSEDGNISAVDRAIRANRHEIFEKLTALEVPMPEFSTDEVFDIYSNVLRRGNPEMIRYLLSLNSKLDDKYGYEAFLGDALAFGNEETIRLIIRQLKRVKLRSWFTKETFLHSASKFASADVISLLVENGFKINEKITGGSTPLYLAIESDRGREASFQLLELGANPNIIPRDEPPLLRLALLKNDWELIEKLLEAGATVKDRQLLNDIVEMAVRSSANSIIEYLFNKGALKELKFFEDIPVVAAADYYSNEELVQFCEANGQSLESNSLGPFHHLN